VTLKQLNQVQPQLMMQVFKNRMRFINFLHGEMKAEFQDGVTRALQSVRIRQRNERGGQVRRIKQPETSTVAHSLADRFPVNPNRSPQAVPFIRSPLSGVAGIEAVIARLYF
jgi:hypothetical protein